MARLLAPVCDKLIVHPNVVNASDINEMPTNCLYVEGAMLDRFLEGNIGLKEVKSNKILVVVNSPINPETINSVSAAKVTLGIDAYILELKEKLILKGYVENGNAVGDIEGWEALVDQVAKYDFDALAISSPIEVEEAVGKDYLRNGGINPWGGVEAKLSKLVSKALDKPVAHAPTDSGNWFKDFNEVVDPRMAAEMVSVCYLHCVLKGLHKAPRVSNTKIDLMVRNIDCLVSPYGCWGKPHEACKKADIPIIMIKENRVCRPAVIGGSVITVNNYHECVGVLVGLKNGISIESIRRPITQTIHLKQSK